VYTIILKVGEEGYTTREKFLTTTMLQVHQCGPLYLCGPFTFMGPLPTWGPFASVWPFHTYIVPFTTIWSPFTT